MLDVWPKKPCQEALILYNMICKLCGLQIQAACRNEPRWGKNSTWSAMRLIQGQRERTRKKMARESESTRVEMQSQLSLLLHSFSIVMSECLPSSERFLLVCRIVKQLPCCNWWVRFKESLKCLILSGIGNMFEASPWFACWNRQPIIQERYDVIDCVRLVKSRTLLPESLMPPCREAALNQDGDSHDSSGYTGEAAVPPHIHSNSQQPASQRRRKQEQEQGEYLSVATVLWNLRVIKKMKPSSCHVFGKWDSC